MPRLVIFEGSSTGPVCWSRLVFEPWAIQVLLGVIGVIYLVGTVLCFTGKPPASMTPLRRWLLASGFIVVSLSGLVAGYVYKVSALISTSINH